MSPRRLAISSLTRTTPCSTHPTNRARRLPNLASTTVTNQSVYFAAVQSRVAAQLSQQRSIATATEHNDAVTTEPATAGHSLPLKPKKPRSKHSVLSILTSTLILGIGVTGHAAALRHDYTQHWLKRLKKHCLEVHGIPAEEFDRVRDSVEKFEPLDCHVCGRDWLKPRGYIVMDICPIEPPEEG